MTKKIKSAAYLLQTSMLLLLCFFALEQPLLIAGIIVQLALSALWFYNQRLTAEKIHFYEQIVDAIENPLSVTDLDMKWTFVNKAATDPLGVTRESVLGSNCHNWGANICQTEKCGINCLRQGQSTTFFNQWDKDFKVTTKYLVGLNGEKIGHVEIVQDISEKTALQNVYQDLIRVGSHLTERSQGLNLASDSLSQGVSQQASAVTQIGVSLDSTVADANLNAKRATMASQLADQASQLSEQAAQDMNEFESTMADITQSSEAIGEIIQVIDDIAAQTNLLALNASIEAARAGEMGRGFAVVADEVRQLAERSTKAAQQSSEHLQQSIDSVGQGNRIAVRCVQSLQNVVQQLAEINRTVAEIDQNSNQQAQHLDQIHQSISEIDEVVHRSATSAEETRNVANEFSQLSKDMENQLKGISKIEGLITSASAGNKIEATQIS